MMWRALSKIARKPTAGYYGTQCCVRKAHPLLLSEHWYGHSNNCHDGLTPPTPQHFAPRPRAFHSTVSVLEERNRIPQLRQRGNFNKNRDSHANNQNRNGRQGNNNFNHQGNSQFSPTYISHLEQRAREHINNFPVDASSNDREFLSPWHRTTVELVMLMSKIWGKGHHQSDQRDICNLVSLANDMVVKVLTVRENELDDLIDESESHVSCDGDKPYNNERQQQFGRRSMNKNMNTEILCQTVALGWSRCDAKIAVDAARNAQKILDRLESMCSRREKMNNNTEVSFELHDVVPSIQLYNHVLFCWSRSSDSDAERRGRDLLDRMIRDRSCRVDTISYNNILHLYANKGKADAAEALLQQMEDPRQKVSADVISYSIVMNALQKRFVSNGPNSRNMKDPERAEELLSHLVTMYEKSGFRNAKLRPTSVTFGTVIAMYAQADRIVKKDDQTSRKTRSWKAGEMAMNLKNNNNNVGWGASNAERVLDWIIGLSERERQKKNTNSGFSEDGAETRHRDGTFNHYSEVIKPSTYHFVTVMDAWAKAKKGVEGAQHCERLLDRLVSLYNKLGYAELRPNPMCYGAVIYAWSKADDKHETAEHAESLLYRMEDLFLDRKSSNPKEMLSNIAYNLVIDAWSRRSGNDKAERAETILRRLVKNYELTGNRFLRPDVISYTATMKALVNHPQGGERALKILEDMKNQHRSGNTRAAPDAQSLAVAMDACAKSGLTSEAERILNDTRIKTFVMFNTVMSGHKKEGRGREAEAVLRRMIDLSDNAGQRNCSPDVVSYSICIEAWGNSTSQDRVLRSRMLLDETIKRYQSGDSRCKPSNSTFNVVALTIAKSDDPDREALVLALFEKMEAIGLEPCLVSFNILIKTCASATGSQEKKNNALQIAASAYTSLPSVGLEADSYTYISIFNAMLNLMEDSPEKVKAVGGIFRRCCEDGYLNQHMINVLAGVTSEVDFLSITGVSLDENGSAPRIKNFPANWSCRASDDNSTNMELLS